MNVLEELIKIKQSLAVNDRRDAMNVLIKKLYYEIAPRVTTGDSFMLFSDESILSKFCQNNNLDIRAVKWLLDAMRDEGLIDKNQSAVILTPLCIEKFCIN